jgi:hypothetical protein
MSRAVGAHLRILCNWCERLRLPQYKLACARRYAPKCQFSSLPRARTRSRADFARACTPCPCKGNPHTRRRASAPSRRAQAHGTIFHSFSFVEPPLGAPRTGTLSPARARQCASHAPRNHQTHYRARGPPNRHLPNDDGGDDGGARDSQGHTTNGCINYRCLPRIGSNVGHLEVFPALRNVRHNSPGASWPVRSPTLKIYFEI